MINVIYFPLVVTLIFWGQNIPESDLNYMREHPEDREWLKTHVRPRFWKKFVAEPNMFKPPGTSDIEE